MEESTDFVERMKNRFYATLFSKDFKYNSVLMTKQKYDSIIEVVKRIKMTKKKESPRDYRISERYDVSIVQGTEKLIEHTPDVRENVKVFVHADELFDVLYFAHLSVGHGGRDKMLKWLSAVYKNVTQAQVKLFLEFCEICQQKQKNDKRGIVTDSITTSDSNAYCQTSGTAAKEVEKKDHLPIEPTVEIKEEPTDYASNPSTSSNNTNEEFILPHEENSWATSDSVVEPRFTLSVANLSSPNGPETSDGEQPKKKRKPNPNRITSTSTFVPPVKNGPRRTSESPVYNFDEFPMPSSFSNESRGEFPMPSFSKEPRGEYPPTPNSFSKEPRGEYPTPNSFSKEPRGEFSTPGSASKESRKDQFDVFGEYIAAKLRSLDRRSCAFAQKAIGDIIFDAEMGKYLTEGHNRHTITHLEAL